MQCLQEFGQPNREITYVDAHIEFCDDGHYDFVCSFNHKTTLFLKQQKFQILFDLGANAIVDRYYREAVSSFNSSMERFYEFTIRIVLNNYSKSDDLFKCCWKKVSNSSERQLGAFIFLWASTFGNNPELLSEKLTKFRNDVIHKGRIPSKKESIEFGDAVLGVIRPKMLELLDRFQDDVDNILFHQMAYLKNNLGGHQVTTLGLPTILSMSTRESAYHQKSLEEHLNEIILQRKIFHKNT
jgi:hypothetical protein